jgi:YVTN family beta-propeller protein
MNRFVACALFVSAVGICMSAQDKAAGWLVVLNKSEATVSIVDPVSLKVVARVPTGEGPHEAITSADGKLAFVANYGTGPKPGNSISVIDLDAKKELRRVDLGALQRPHGIMFVGGKVYFTAEGSYAAARYDPASDKVDWITGTGQAATHMIVVTPDEKKAYTANIGSNTVSVIRLGPMSPPAGGPPQPRVTQISVGDGPEGIDLSPDGRELWVAHRGDGGLSIIDVASDTVKEKLQVGRTPIRVKFTPDGKRVLISDAQANELVVFDAVTRKELKRIPVGAVPVGIQIAPDGKRAFIAATQANKVFVIDLESLSVAGQIEPGREPDGMAWAKR